VNEAGCILSAICHLLSAIIRSMSSISSEKITSWLERFAELVAQNKDYLTKLDSAIGDADHGANMDRGFQAVLAKKNDLAGKDIATVFKTTAMTLLSTVGGASGPLYATFFLQAAQAAGPKTEISPEEFGTLLEKALAGVIQRGKAALGDKTMVDALQPATESYQAALKAGKPFPEALEIAAHSAEAGMNGTVPLLAKKGRASYLGERSIGHQDPGATSVNFLFQAARETLA
jgi:phosphoenolpyruvate---glycerone phosphotransferase subunit DhaL